MKKAYICIRQYQKSEFILLIFDGVLGLFLIQTFLKNRDLPTWNFKIPKLKLEIFVCFFNPPPPLGIFPKFSRFFLVMAPLSEFSDRCTVECITICAL